MYDLVIKNGKIIDGTGSPSYFSDIAITDGKIVCISKGLQGAKKTIDAKGLVVTPGFIDSHSHVDNAMLTYPDQTEKIEQGITTSIAGQCGETQAPISKDANSETAEIIGEFGKATDVFKTMGTFLNIVKTVPQGSNTATYVGFNAIRSAVMGMENRHSTKEELDKMKVLLRDAMENGAMGLSFGFEYTPGCFASFDELVELAKVVAEYNGLISAHLRSEDDFLFEAVEEFLTIVRKSGVRGVISHHKSAKKENWGKVNHTLKMIDEINQDGYEVYLDVYPYTASHTSLASMMVLRKYRAGGSACLVENLENYSIREELKQSIINRWGEDMSFVMITKCKAYPGFVGMRVPEIAKIHGKDVYDTMFDLIKDSNDDCNACYFTMCEDDIETVLKHPRAMIATDSSVARGNTYYHPRLRGTFPRVLGRYVRERRITTLSEMIRKMTSMPARVYGLKGKGILSEGFDADICIFDEEKIIDCAEFDACHKKAEGLNYVILNGEIVVENSNYNGKRMGKIILIKR